MAKIQGRVCDNRVLDVQRKEYQGKTYLDIASRNTGGTLVNGVYLDDAGLVELRDAIDAHLNRPQTRTIVLEVTVNRAYGDFNPFQLSGHLRKYLREQRGSFCGDKVKIVSNSAYDEGLTASA